MPFKRLPGWQTSCRKCLPMLGSYQFRLIAVGSVQLAYLWKRGGGCRRVARMAATSPAYPDECSSTGAASCTGIQPAKKWDGKGSEHPKSQSPSLARPAENLPGGGDCLTRWQSSRLPGLVAGIWAKAQASGAARPVERAVHPGGCPTGW